MTPPDPRAFQRKFWPDVKFYKQQWEVIYSVVENDETFVPAGNMLGKDYVAGFIVLYFFLTRHPCRIVTTSAKDDHLRVLWGEVGRFLDSCAVKLKEKDGGPLIVNHQDLRKIVNGTKCPLSYAMSMVASPQSMAAMQGHHVAKTGDGVPRTLFVSDESSSVADAYYQMAKTWMNRSLVIGNTWPCDNFFKYAVKGKPGTDDKGGDVPSDRPGRYYRKVVRITAEDSPNVKLALAQIAAGLTPTGEMVVPGVKDWDEYKKNRQMWDEVQQCVSLDANFYEGADVKLYPMEWVTKAVSYAGTLSGKRRTALAMGVDTAEGGDNTCWCVVDEDGVIELISKKTPNTAVIPGETLALMQKHGLRGDQVGFDRGGGGMQHADVLREKGFKVRTIGFGEGVTDDPKHWKLQMREKLHARESRYTYLNRRAQMYGHLRLLLEPDGEGRVTFGLPAAYRALVEQMGPVPLQYDSEGRLKVPKKSKSSPGETGVTLIELIGHSPDELDALVVACHVMAYKVVKAAAACSTRTS